MGKYKVKVDRSLCIGAGSCEAIAPQAFRLDNNGKVILRKKEGLQLTNISYFEELEETAENIWNAAKACPVNAIKIIEVDEEGNERQIWPPEDKRRGNL